MAETIVGYVGLGVAGVLGLLGVVLVAPGVFLLFMAIAIAAAIEEMIL
jgi:hypothetical protein